MRRLTCDVAIIGAGTAGLSAYKAAAKEGAAPLLIESGPLGTTCARVGCMPSKLLLAAAHAAHGVRTAGIFGIRAEEPRVDGRAVMARLRRERDRFVAGVIEGMNRIPAESLVRGRARFVGPTTLAVDDVATVEARAVVIATGSASAVPEAFRSLGSAVLTNETVFELDDLPASLAVIGAGPLGLELAQGFARLGTRVVVYDRGERIGSLHDRETESAAREAIGREVTLRLGTKTVPRAVDRGIAIAWRADGGAGEDVVEAVLVAAGRPPNLAGLELDRTGLRLDDRGVPVFEPETLQCGDGPVFIAGDCDADRPVLHEASDEGWIAGRNAARFPRLDPTRRATPLAITYTDPEMAVVGASLGGLDPADTAYGRVDLAASGRARVMAENRGAIVLAGRRSDGRLLGGEIVGPDAEHLGHLLAWAVQLDLTVDAALDLPFYHPTLEESLRGALRDLCSELDRHPARLTQGLAAGG